MTHVNYSKPQEETRKPLTLERNIKQSILKRNAAIKEAIIKRNLALERVRLITMIALKLL